jgi:hypothetical protein
MCFNVNLSIVAIITFFTSHYKINFVNIVYILLSNQRLNIYLSYNLYDSETWTQIPLITICPNLLMHCCKNTFIYLHGMFTIIEGFSTQKS